MNTQRPASGLPLNGMPQSLRIEEHQMRSHYNIAILEAVYGKPDKSETEEAAKIRYYQNAIKELNIALNARPKRWQRSAPPKVAESMIFYNRGCYVAWLLGNDRNKQTLDISDAQRFLDDLSEAAKLGGISKHVIDSDFDPGVGDDSDIVRKPPHNSCVKPRKTPFELKGQL
jgi:hypothetical protein